MDKTPSFSLTMKEAVEKTNIISNMGILTDAFVIVRYRN